MKNLPACPDERMDWPAALVGELFFGCVTVFYEILLPHRTTLRDKTQLKDMSNNEINAEQLHKSKIQDLNWLLNARYHVASAGFQISIGFQYLHSPQVTFVLCSPSIAVFTASFMRK